MQDRAARYRDLAKAIEPTANRDELMQRVVDAAWEVLRTDGVSWLGFYIDQPDEPNDRRLVLGPHRDRPACSPIGLNGVCGRALLEGRSIVVEDVLDLGDGYIACDPRDRAELVVPVFVGDTCWGVFDVDSTEPGRFTSVDRDGIRAMLQAAGFSTD